MDWTISIFHMYQNIQKLCTGYSQHYRTQNPSKTCRKEKRWLTNNQNKWRSEEYWTVPCSLTEVLASKRMLTEEMADQGIPWSSGPLQILYMTCSKTEEADHEILYHKYEKKKQIELLVICTNKLAAILIHDQLCPMHEEGELKLITSLSLLEQRWKCRQELAQISATAFFPTHFAVVQILFACTLNRTDDC